MVIIDPRVPPNLVPDGSKPLVLNDVDHTYLDLPSIITPLQQVITRWSPTDQERAAILRGEDIYVTTIGLPIRPMMVTVGVVDWRHPQGVSDVHGHD